MKTWILALLLCLAALSGPPSEAKPFRRALVLAGGGLAPGLGLGMIAGLEAAGWKPDVILATCGSATSAGLYSASPTTRDALAYAKSREYHRALRQLVRIDTRFAPALKAKFENVLANPGLLPDLFDGTILRIPEVVPRLVPDDRLRAVPGKARLVILAARANYGPEHVGIRMSDGVSYKQVFFTDASTARHLRGRASDIKRVFPESYVHPATETMTNVSLSQAARASVSDPYYINPARIGDHYYFTGAIDLFPIRTARALADEVIVTYPSTDYSDYEVLAISSSLGFDQSHAARLATRARGVRFIHLDGSGVGNFDPKLFGIIFQGKLPRSHARYVEIVDAQYALGFERAYRAARGADR